MAMCNVTEVRNEVFNAIKENRLYGYIACEYWNMTTDILKDILLEVVYSSDFDADELEENLRERWNMYEDEE